MLFRSRAGVSAGCENQIWKFFEEGGQVIIYDANNGTRAARATLAQKFEKAGIHVIFLGTFPLARLIKGLVTQISLLQRVFVIARRLLRQILEVSRYRPLTYGILLYSPSACVIESILVQGLGSGTSC